MSILKYYNYGGTLGLLRISSCIRDRCVHSRRKTSVWAVKYAVDSKRVIEEGDLRMNYLFVVWYLTLLFVVRWYIFVICCIFVAYSQGYLLYICCIFVDSVKDFHSSNLGADVCIGATPVKIIGIKILWKLSVIVKIVIVCKTKAQLVLAQ